MAPKRIFATNQHRGSVKSFVEKNFVDRRVLQRCISCGTWMVVQKRTRVFRPGRQGWGFGGRIGGWGGVIFGVFFVPKNTPMSKGCLFSDYQCISKDRSKRMIIEFLLTCWCFFVELFGGICKSNRLLSGTKVVFQTFRVFPCHG